MSIEEKITIGDITDRTHGMNVIIAMNDTLSEPTPFAAPYVIKMGFRLKDSLPLGSVLSFPFTESTQLHMIICHKIGIGGWIDADKHLRFALDFLDHHRSPGEKFAIVEIGTGPIGIRDGANAGKLKTAMANSFLPLTLYIKPQSFAVAVAVQPQLVAPLRVWYPNKGVQPIPLPHPIPIDPPLPVRIPLAA